MPEYKPIFLASGLSAPVRGLVNIIARNIFPRLYAHLLDGVHPMTTLEYQTNIGQIQEFKSEWMKYWKQNKLDFVIAPGFGCQAVKHSLSEHTALAATYTFLWNVLDMPSLAMPVTRVRADEQVYESAHKDLLTSKLI